MSQQLIEAKILDEPLEIKIHTNLGVYVSRAYRLFEADEWDMFLKYTDEGQELLTKAVKSAVMKDRKRNVDKVYYGYLKALLRKDPQQISPDERRMWLEVMEYDAEVEKQLDEGTHDYLIHKVGDREKAKRKLMIDNIKSIITDPNICLLYTSPSPRD